MKIDHDKLNEKLLDLLAAGLDIAFPEALIMTSRSDPTIHSRSVGVWFGEGDGLIVKLQMKDVEKED